VIPREGVESVEEFTRFTGAYLERDPERGS
jgi:hypothetical protein